MEYGDFIIYVDESGDHSLKSIDSHYPIFVLVFCIFDKNYYTKYFSPALQNIKFDYFGHDSIVFHEREIHKKRGDFSFLQNEEIRNKFLERLSSLIENSKFTVITAIIDKKNLRARYINPHNPYKLALTFCMERAWRFLKMHHQQDRITHIVVEGRGHKDDEMLRNAFERIREGDYLSGAMPGFDIRFADKKINSAGLQLADLIARPIGRQVLSPEQENRAWKIIKGKLYKEGGFREAGLKIFP